jgi:hypothetical protein
MVKIRSGAMGTQGTSKPIPGHAPATDIAQLRLSRGSERRCRADRITFSNTALTAHHHVADALLNYVNKYNGDKT